MNLDPVGTVYSAVLDKFRKRAGRVNKARSSSKKEKQKGSEDPSREKGDFSARLLSKAVTGYDNKGKFVPSDDDDPHSTLDVDI